MTNISLPYMNFSLLAWLIKTHPISWDSADWIPVILNVYTMFCLKIAQILYVLWGYYGNITESASIIIRSDIKAKLINLDVLFVLIQFCSLRWDSHRKCVEKDNSIFLSKCWKLLFTELCCVSVSPHYHLTPWCISLNETVRINID